MPTHAKVFPLPPTHAGFPATGADSYREQGWNSSLRDASILGITSIKKIFF